MSPEIRLRPWARILLAVAAPMRLFGMMGHSDVAALRAFVAQPQLSPERLAQMMDDALEVTQGDTNGAAQLIYDDLTGHKPEIVF